MSANYLPDVLETTEAERLDLVLDQPLGRFLEGLLNLTDADAAKAGAA